MKMFYTTAALLGIVTMGTALYAQSSTPTVECSPDRHKIYVKGTPVCIPGKP